MERTFRTFSYLSISLLLLWLSAKHKSSAQLVSFPLPSAPLSRPPGVQVDGEGRTFVAAGNQLFRLSRDLVPELSVNLSSDAVNISLSSGGDLLVVCTTDLSCAVYNTGNLTIQALVNNEGMPPLRDTDRVALFTTEDSFYVGSLFSGTPGTISLRQVDLEDGSYIRSEDYEVLQNPFFRDFYSGFTYGNYSYFIAVDYIPIRALKIMRVCHVTGGCPCSFSALYEEDFICGAAVATNDNDRICGLSVMNNFAGSPETTIIVTRCRPSSTSRNLVCAMNLTDVDRNMDLRYSECAAGNGGIDVTWIGGAGAACAGNFQPVNVCDFGGVPALDDSDSVNDQFVPAIPVTTILDIGGNAGSPKDPRGADIYASIAIQVDNFSLMMVAYDDDDGNYVGIFLVTGARVTLGNVFDEKQFSSPVRTLDWKEGLEIVIAATDSEVIRIPIEECSSNDDCSGCIMEDNPLCGWCVVENKCSRQSLCRDGSSTTSTRWIPSNTSADDVSAQCIINTITPNQYEVDNGELLSVLVGGPGLPTKIGEEIYSCFFEDNEGRFTITVPSVEVTSGTRYTCNITNQVPVYDGVAAVMHFSFISSLIGEPFDRTNNSLTIFRCGATDRCSDCLDTNNVCGWCVVNKQCSGTAQDCTNTSNFLTVVGMDTFLDVCPLLDLMGGTTNYTQHVTISSNLELTTRNLPDTIPGYSYMCRIGGMDFNAVRNNEMSITCQVNGLTLSSNVGSEVADISIIWSGPGVDPPHAIDTLNDTSVVLYDCNVVANDCSSCIGSRDTSNFLCGWCESSSSCRIDELCTGSSSVITMGGQCPGPDISNISPISGPPSGGTIITITGTNLGVTFDDFSAPNSIVVGGVTCTPISMNYIPGRRILCETGGGMSVGDRLLVITLTRDDANTGLTNIPFDVVLPSVISVSPVFGPIAGGSQLTIMGTGLDIGNSARVTLNGSTGPDCEVIGPRSASAITCSTPEVNSSSSSPFQVLVYIDNELIENTEVTFLYRNNPNFTSIIPAFTIPAGGVMIFFIGSDLDVAQNPRLLYNGIQFPCSIVNSTALSCISPTVTGDPVMIAYRLILDNVPPPDPTRPELLLSLRPNPGNFMLVTKEVSRNTANSIVQIEGENLDSVTASEVKVTVGEAMCNITSLSADLIVCRVPDNPVLDANNRATVIVFVGLNSNVSLPDTVLFTSPPSGIPLTIIIPAVVAPVALILICCVVWIVAIIGISRKQGKKKEQQYTSLIAKMEMIEYEMADECKRAFTELQTDLADLVQISADKNLPYRDFRTFAMRFLFPKAGDDHPVLLPLEVTGVKMEKDAVLKQLERFQELMMDKKFLLVFVHTLESQPSFSLQDKVTVASLLLVAFQNDLDYATDVLQTLLAEIMRKTIAKSHPKLLLRRTESVAEKMLANWLAFLLFPYLLEHVGEPLFILFRAIKSQLEKGPVDIISGEAKNALSEEKLLRQHMEVNPVECIIEHDGEEICLKMWDCDSITQAKEKVLDALYRNTPVSKRPQLTDIDLELVGKGENGVTLRDRDASSKKEGEWIRINTLGHYRLDEMSKSHTENPKLPVPRFRIVFRKNSNSAVGSGYDTLGTIISNISAANRGSMVMSTSELGHVYHLVKPDPEDGDGSGGTRIMSEVFLTRLLSTKRILQPYVDKLFDSIFAVPHGKVLPKAIKSLFDFLDLQAAELGITDSEVLHSWKTNSVPLRFWVNVIKNPDFVFDINKSATVDACLTVIAQAYIDATSTADIKYTKDTPSARLLYVNEVKKYKVGVENYYSSIQSLPKLSNSEMAEYLRDTAQVCANSVKQYDSSVVHDNDPASMTRQLYFVTESALFELYKYASEYSDDIIDALNEEGLTLPAAHFDQILKALS